MDVMVTAGSILSDDDPLYQLTQIKKKALIPLLDRPMIDWVIEAIVQANVAKNLVIVGLEPGEIDPPAIATHYLPSTNSLVNNVVAGQNKLLSLNPNLKKILLLSSDIPLITPQIIHGFLAECGDWKADLYYAIVEEQIMERQFPNSQRSFIPAKGGRYTGGDAFLVRADIKPDVEFVQGLTAARKNYLKQAKMFGYGLIFRFLTRRLTAFEGVNLVGKRIGVDHAEAVATRFPELAMDLDKLHHYHVIKTVLAERVAK